MSLLFATTVIIAAVSTVGLTVIHRHARDLERRLRDADRSAHTDPLTGLANRAGLTRELDKLQTAVVDDHIAGILLDLDDLKPINDQHGHEAGDKVLAEVAQRIERVTAPNAVCTARLGGDEFVVLFKPKSGYLQASQSAEKLAHTICTSILRPIRIDDVHPGSVAISVSASAGVAVMPAHRLGQLIAAADIAMYRAKASGATVCRYQPQIDLAPAPVRRPAHRLRDQHPRRDPLVALPTAPPQPVREAG